MTLIEELRKRELFYNVTDEELEKYLQENKVNFYLGADPTGDSLHVGHLCTFLVAKRMMNYGHHPILLIGGATGLIGDPKMQGERKMLTLEQTLENARKLTAQVHNIFGFEEIVNNYEWIKDISLISFLRDYGKEFNVNYMINKETVKSRLESGISYTEFSYQILQALDFNHLFDNKNCTVQIGGQDQWGNITSGIELIRKKHDFNAKAYGLTVPLILKTDGTKFGKSEDGKSVWLDKDKTSHYEFYQFWINIPDNEVIKRLKQFTFLSLDEIDEIEQEFLKAPHLRYAQKRLAEEVTKYVHGEEAFNQALKITEALFSGDISNLNGNEIEMGFKDILMGEIDENTSLIDCLMISKLAQSKREARELISGNAITVNGNKFSSLDKTLTKEDAIENKYLLIKKGKKKYSLLTIK